MSYAKYLRCKECHRDYPLDPIHVCEWCFGPLEVYYDYEAIKPRRRPPRDRARPADDVALR